MGIILYLLIIPFPSKPDYEDSNANKKKHWSFWNDNFQTGIAREIEISITAKPCLSACSLPGSWNWNTYMEYSHHSCYTPLCFSHYESISKSKITPGSQSEKLCSVTSNGSFSVFCREMPCLPMRTQEEQSIPGTPLYFIPLGEHYWS